MSSDNTIYRAAIVGLGNIAWLFDCDRDAPAIINTHVSAYLNNPRIELVGGCSPVAVEREQFAAAFGVAVYESMEELLAETGPDIVSICSPSEFHFVQTRKCLERGVPMVWLEKPSASSLAEIDRLLVLRSN